MLEAFTSGKFQYKRLSLEEQKKRGILGRLIGVIADGNNATRNGRKYSVELWKHVFDSDIMKEKIANRCMFGQLGHPDYEEVDPEKIAICLAEQPKLGNDGKLYGVFDIVSTPCGKILKSLCDYGCNIGVSSRGTGDLYQDEYGEEAVDPESYVCECFDAVLIPAVKEARLQYVTESLEKTKRNKSLKQVLTESLHNASEDDRAIMEDTLDNLGIDLEEDEEDNIITDLYNDEEVEYDEINDSEETESEDDFEDEESEDDFEDEESEDDFEDGESETEGNSETVSEVSNIPPGTEVTYKDGRPAGISKDFGDYMMVELPPKSGVGRGEYVKVSKDDLFIDGDIPISEAFPTKRKNTDSLVEQNVHVTATKNEAGGYDIKKSGEELDERAVPYSRDRSRMRREDEVDNVKSKEIVAELHEALKQIKKLREDNRSLQEKLSVCNAKESDLTEQLACYKQAAVTMSDKVREVKKLNESLKSNVSNSKELRSLQKANLELSEKYNDIKQQYSTKATEASGLAKQLAESKQLVESYKKSYRALKDFYLEAKAQSCGLQKSEVLKNLNESYKVKDINQVCESLMTQKKKINRLPFVSNNRINIGEGLSIQQSNSQNPDDYVSQELLQFLQ